jgi:hypothetical protein
MDYKGGTELWMHQWKKIQSPDRVWLSFLEGEEEGEWTTDGHYYTVQLVALMMGLDANTALELGKTSEEPDSHVTSDIDMEEKDTWLIGGLQQRYHALTGGYHGVELAITTYAIIKTHTNEAAFLYLLHRFGDDYAHFNIDHDKEGLTTTVKLTDYIEALDKYLNQLIDKKFRINPYFKVPTFDKNEDGTIVTNYSKQTLILQIIDFLLKGIHGSAFHSDDLTWEKLQEDILKELPFAIQNNFKMYGEDQIKCFTSGHASEGSAPDNIVDRKNLYLLYVDNLVELISIKYGINLSDNVKTNIHNKISEILDYIKYSTVNRLDGILAYEIAVLKNPSDKYIYIYMPIKYVNEDNLSLQGKIYSIIFTPAKDANSIKDDAYKYFDKSGVFEKYDIDSAIKTKNNIQFWEFKLIKK